MSEIIGKVKTFVQKMGFNPIVAPNNDDMIILAGLNGSNGGQFNVHLIGKDASKDSPTILLVLSSFPIKVPSNKRERILSFLNKLNQDAWYTWLALSFDNGEIICRSCNRSMTNDAMNDDIIEPVIFSSIGRLDGLQPFIMDLIYSEKPVDTVLKEMQATTN